MVLRLRALLFTVLVPGTVAGWAPLVWIGHGPAPGGLWNAGYLVAGAGVALYLWCLACFLAAGGTPAIHFTRPLRWAIGEEPAAVVLRGPYRFSRNPMYLAVALTIAGEALAFASWQIAWYAAAVWLVFHLVVVLVEEPHLAAQRGPAYEELRGTVPRWIGKKRRT